MIICLRDNLPRFLPTTVDRIIWEFSRKKEMLFFQRKPTTESYQPPSDFPFHTYERERTIILMRQRHIESLIVGFHEIKYN